MQAPIELASTQREELVDITDQVAAIVARSGIRQGIVSIYAQGATAAIMIQENWDDSVQTDVVNLLRQLIPQGVWLHDRQDGNGDAHLKAGLVGRADRRWQAGPVALAKHLFLRIRRTTRRPPGTVYAATGRVSEWGGSPVDRTIRGIRRSTPGLRRRAPFSPCGRVRGACGPPVPGYPAAVRSLSSRGTRR